VVEPGELARVVAEPVALAAAIQAAALIVPGVVAMSPGRGFVEATYGPGVTVHGVGMGVYHDHLEVSVHLVVGLTAIPTLARELRRVIRTVIREYTGRSADTINLYIDDIVLEARPGGDGVV
jgi:uncharacterized alkaline shock family protein YloU